MSQKPIWETNAEPADKGWVKGEIGCSVWLLVLLLGAVVWALWSLTDERFDRLEALHPELTHKESAK